MSNRYVWDRHNIGYTDKMTQLSKPDSGSGSCWTLKDNMEWSGGPNGVYTVPYWVVIGKTYSRNGNKYTLSGSRFAPNEDDNGGWAIGFSLPASYYNDDTYETFYLAIATSSDQTTFDHIYQFSFKSNTSITVSGNHWDDGQSLMFSVPMSPAGWFHIYNQDHYCIEAIPSKGSLVGTVSNSGASTYPPRDYSSKSARIWPYSTPFMRCSGGLP